MTLEALALPNATNDVTTSNDSLAQSWPQYNHCTQPNNDDTLAPHVSADHFIVRNGIEFAGTHLIIDFAGASKLDDVQLMEVTLRKAVAVSEATLLHIHLHHFTPNGGISGVAVLAESHISVHTWPERNYAAFDVFMCGDAKPEAAIPVLEAAFKPTHVSVSEHLRGVNNHLGSQTPTNR